MPYEFRMDGKSVQTFDTEEEAVSHAKDAMRTRPESEPEIFDTVTGKPISPGASKAWRDDLASKVGF
jgi:hypothetical protein